MTINKIALMHQFFGKGEGVCKDCNHFLREQYRSKTYRKCDVYGITNSEASDWKASYQACGLFNKEYNGRDMIYFVTPERKHEIDNEPLDGQIDLLGGDAI